MTDAKPFTAEEIAAEVRRVDHNCDYESCDAMAGDVRAHETTRRYLATIHERDARIAELEAERDTWKRRAEAAESDSQAERAELAWMERGASK